MRKSTYLCPRCGRRLLPPGPAELPAVLYGVWYRASLAGINLSRGIKLSCSEYFGDPADDRDLYLIGDWLSDNEGNYQINKDGKYGYAAQICEATIHVVWSKTTRRCMINTPGFPPQGDIESIGIGDYVTFVLPHTFYQQMNITKTE